MQELSRYYKCPNLVVLQHRFKFLFLTKLQQVTAGIKLALICKSGLRRIPEPPAMRYQHLLQYTLVYCSNLLVVLNARASKLFFQYNLTHFRSISSNGNSATSTVCQSNMPPDQ
jgi:hypothetical protein